MNKYRRILFSNMKKSRDKGILKPITSIKIQQDIYNKTQDMGLLDQIRRDLNCYHLFDAASMWIDQFPQYDEVIFNTVKKYIRI